MNKIGIVNDFSGKFVPGLIYKIDTYKPEHKKFVQKSMISQIEDRDIEPGTPVSYYSSKHSSLKKFRVLTEAEQDDPSVHEMLKEAEAEVNDQAAGNDDNYAIPQRFRRPQF